MDAGELLRTRLSALKLGEPAPSARAVQAMLESAGRAPDHGCLRPWRLILIEGDARLDFGKILGDALSRRNPLADEQALAREREKALRAPLIIVVATRCDRSSKIPIIEQIVSAGCAAHGILLAAVAEGLGAMWRTGNPAYDNEVKKSLGIEPDDLIVGFIHVGTDFGGPGIRPRQTPREFAQHWPGDGARPSGS
jgi:nitroreductase